MNLGVGERRGVGLQLTSLRRRSAAKDDEVARLEADHARRSDPCWRALLNGDRQLPRRGREREVLAAEERERSRDDAELLSRRVEKARDSCAAQAVAMRKDEVLAQPRQQSRVRRDDRRRDGEFVAPFGELLLRDLVRGGALGVGASASRCSRAAPTRLDRKQRVDRRRMDVRVAVQSVQNDV